MKGLSWLKQQFREMGEGFVSVQQMLESAINIFGINDEVTILLSQKRDKEIAELQAKRYKEWKSRGICYGEK